MMEGGSNNDKGQNTKLKVVSYFAEMTLLPSKRAQMSVSIGSAVFCLLAEIQRSTYGKKRALNLRSARVLAIDARKS